MTTNENHFVWDVRMAELANGYPDSSEESSLQLCRLWYILHHQFSPSLDDFDLATKDDGKKETWFFGPFTVFYPPKKKKELQQLLIGQFIRVQLKLDVSDKVLEQQHLYFPDAKKHTFFITWKWWNEETFMDLRVRFHASEIALCPEMFICVGQRDVHDALVCVHPKAENSTETDAITNHITQCLGKTNISDYDVTDTWSHPWRNQKDQKIIDRKDQAAIQFAVDHPYLNRHTIDPTTNKMIYTPGSSWIDLSSDEKNLLVGEQKLWLENIENNVTNELKDSF